MRCRNTLQLICAALLVWAASVLPAYGQTRHVVLLYDERTDLPGLAMLDASIVRTLTAGSPDQIEVYREDMDLSRFDSDAYRNLLRNHLRAKYTGKRIDVAVAVMGPALDFLLRHRNEVFPATPETPIVFCGIDRRRFGDRSLPSRVTGVLVKREFSPTLELAVSLHPSTERIVVVSGTSEFDTSLVEQAREEFRGFENRLAFTYLSALPLRELLSELSRLPPRTIVLYSTLFRDGAGEPFVPHEVAERVSNAANAPVYGFVDQYVGRGIVGGRLYSLAMHGEAVARLVLQILAGKQPAELPLIEPENSVTLFDWRQLQRWGLDEKRLPEGSQIRFRIPTFWEQYGGWMVGAISLCVLEAILIVALLLNRRRLHRTQRNLRESEERLSLATSSAKVGVWSWDIRGGKLEATEEWRKIFGWQPDEPLNYEKFIDRVHSEDQAMVERVVEKAVIGGTIYDVEYRIALAEQIRWIAARGQCHRSNGSPTTMTGVVMDITDRKRAEAALIESEERFRIMSEASPVGIFRNNEAGRCVYANNAALRITGNSLEDLQHNGWIRTVHPDDRNYVRHAWAKALGTKSEFGPLEYRFERNGHGVAWVRGEAHPLLSKEGRLVGYVGALTDITERKQAEQALHESEEVHRLTLGHISDAVFITSSTGAFTFICPNVHVIFGYSFSEVQEFGNIARLLGSDVFDPDELETLGEISNLERIIPDKAGREHHLLVTVKRISIRRGTTLFTCRDVTDRKRAEETRHTLAHASRLATVGELTASIAHELNQPLGAILRNAEAAEMILQTRSPDLEELRAIVSDIRADDRRAGDVIDRLRALLKRHKLETQPLDIRKLVEEVAVLMRPDAARRHVKLETDVATGLPLVQGDRVHLQQVLLNLILNSMDALSGVTGDERRVTVRARLDAEQMIEISVSDTGHGIPLEKLGRVFEPFFTTKTDGMGLGLSVSRTLVEAHGGRIRAENNAKGGATFRFTLKVASSEAPTGKGPAKATPPLDDGQ